MGSRAGAGAWLAGLALLALLCSTAAAYEHSGAGERFLEWAKERGAIAPKIEVVEEPELGGYGIRAKSMIRKNDEIVRIPRSLVINRGTLVELFQKDIPEDRKSQGAVDARASLIWGLERMDKMSNGTNTEAHVLAFFILYNRAVPQLLDYGPWLDVLPQEFHNPVHFDESTVELLVGSELYEWTKRLKNQTAEFWREGVSPTVEVLASTMAEAGFDVDWAAVFSLASWKWAMSVVSSRSTFIPHQGLSIALLADVFNHRPYQAAKQPLKQLAENGDLLIVAQQTYGTGSQVYIDYGKMTSADFLQLYGFVDDESENESVPFWFTLHPSDPMVDQKRDFLTDLGYRSELVLPLNRRPSKELMFYLRLLTSHAGDFAVMKEDPMTYFDKMLSPDNELRALMHLIQVADTKRLKFPTDDKGDIVLLDGDDLTVDERLAIQVRLRQKQTLLRLLSYATVARDAAAAEMMEGRGPPPTEAAELPSSVESEGQEERLQQEAMGV
mmetsp:Transcript_2474/g.8811  ORF Transcript_2474/g.8811 Transcript_2474/m.8811 type:complete len:499 (+) Transcript_2474:42-1538(+)